MPGEDELEWLLLCVAEAEAAGRAEAAPARRLARRVGEHLASSPATLCRYVEIVAHYGLLSGEVDSRRATSHRYTATSKAASEAGSEAAAGRNAAWRALSLPAVLQPESLAPLCAALLLEVLH